MSDTIKTTIEFGGITMTCAGNRCKIYLSHKNGNSLDIYNCKYDRAPITNSVFDVPFYIECTDDPSKLHKFCEMKYCGLVDNPHYRSIGNLLREMIKKFDGCVVIGAEDSLVLITKTQPIRLGCHKGAGHVLRDVLVLFGDRRASDCVSFWRVDASKIPEKMIWNPDYDNEVLSMCEKLKDVEL